MNNMEQFVEIKRFPFPELITQLKEIFDANGIDYVIENTKPSFDVTFAGGNIVEYILKVNHTQKEKAIELLSNGFADEFPDDNHYMDSYSDEELIEVISTPEDWDKNDFLYAKKLIEKRGIVVSDEKIEKKKKEIQEDIKKPVKAESIMILMGYLLTILTSGIGVLIALRIKYRKNEIQDNKYGLINYYYDENSRMHANVMIGIFICWLMFYFYLYISQ